jgi:hypothetical protein
MLIQNQLRFFISCDLGPQVPQHDVYYTYRHNKLIKYRAKFKTYKSVISLKTTLGTHNLNFLITKGWSLMACSMNMSLVGLRSSHSGQQKNRKSSSCSTSHGLFDATLQSSRVTLYSIMSSSSILISIVNILEEKDRNLTIDLLERCCFPTILMQNSLALYTFFMLLDTSR